MSEAKKKLLTKKSTERKGFFAIITIIELKIKAIEKKKVNEVDIIRGRIRTYKLQGMNLIC